MKSFQPINYVPYVFNFSQASKLDQVSAKGTIEFAEDGEFCAWVIKHFLVQSREKVLKFLDKYWQWLKDSKFLKKNHTL